MKIAKLFLILGLVSMAGIGVMRVAGVIDSDLASDSLFRIFGIVGILGVTAGGISMIIGGGKSKGDSTKGYGPKF